MKIYRVVVRGHFDDLDDDHRARLRRDAGDHDFLSSSFTADGCLTYDEQLVAFNVRFEVRDRTDERPVVDIEEESITRTAALIAELGCSAKHLRAEVTDMASMWD